jgi:ELWxxDGT repeat protein
MRKISAILTSSLLAFAGVVSFGSPASAADTVDLFLDSFPGTQSYSTPESIHVLGDKLVFLQQGSKLLAYDKTTQTTESLMPNGAVMQSPTYAVAGGKLVFNAWVTTNPGQELYVTDGTLAGTGLLKDILPGTAESQPRNFMQFGNRVVFSTLTAGNASQELWITDGTTAGTTKIRDMSYVVNYGSAVLNGRLYFQGASSGYAPVIWSTDGVTASQVAAITPQEANLTTYGDWVYFNGDSTNAALSNRGGGVTGYELLRTNGTVTEIAYDINATANSGSWSKPTNLAVFNNELYFSANDGTHGYELMKFNGSTVTLIKDEFAGAGSSSPWHMNVFNGKLYYSAVDSINSRELYSSDGTSAGSGLLAEIFPGSVVCSPMDYFCYGGPNSSDPRLFTEYDGKLIFSAVNGTVGGELFAITPPVVIPQVVAPSAPVVQQVPQHVYQGPLFSPIEARRFDATVGGKVVVTGKRLESVTQILLDGKPAEITSATSNQIEFIAPASAPGSPELAIKFGSGTLIWINALTYFDVVVEKAKLQNRIPKAIKPLKKPKPKK